MEGAPAPGSADTMSPEREMVELVLRDLPVRTFVAGRQRQDELMREFALIAHADPETVNTPARLLQVVGAVHERYGVFTDSTSDAIFEAHARGEETIDAVYTLPAEVTERVSDIADELTQLFDEADEYCRSGDLLALAPEPEFVTLRTWMFSEFRRQLVDGHPPTPYSEFSL